jgi:hypothetical protein
MEEPRCDAAGEGVRGLDLNFGEGARVDSAAELF